MDLEGSLDTGPGVDSLPVDEIITDGEPKPSEGLGEGMKLVGEATKSAGLPSTSRRCSISTPEKVAEAGSTVGGILECGCGEEAASRAGYGATTGVKKVSPAEGMFPA